MTHSSKVISKVEQIHCISASGLQKTYILPIIKLLSLLFEFHRKFIFGCGKLSVYNDIVFIRSDARI